MPKRTHAPSGSPERYPVLLTDEDAIASGGPTLATETPAKTARRAVRLAVLAALLAIALVFVLLI